MSKLFKTICALFFLMTWQLAGAEAITNTKEGDKVSGIVTFSERHLFSNKKKADIPLPPGEWTVRLVEKVKSNHSDPVNGVMLALDKIENNLVIESINISAYDQNQRLWNVKCEPGISHQPNLGNYDSECFTLDLKTFMTDSASDWQNKLRKKWNDAGISWGGNALNASLYIISPTFGHVAVYYSIPTGRFLDDSKVSRESPLHSSKLNNADEKVKSSLPALREWYQDYFKRVKEGVYEAKENLPPSRLSAGMHSVVADIEKLAAKATGATSAVAVAEASPKLKVDTPDKKLKNLLDLLDLDDPNVPVELEQIESIASDEIAKGLEQLRIMEAEQERLTRLAEETRTKEREQEKQRALEAEREKAAALQVKKDSEEQVRARWKDTDIAVSQLPPCQGSDIRKWNNCIGENTIYEGNLFERYLGSWKNGQYNGSGILTIHTGANYTGEFKNNLFNGQGTFLWADGRKYIGEFINDKRNGQGIMNYSDGSKYVGEWIYGLRSGKGTMYMPNGIVVSHGVWADDKFVSDEDAVSDASSNSNSKFDKGEKPAKTAPIDQDKHEALLGKWNETGFPISQLPFCAPNVFDNCFGSGIDSNGTEYIGEFKDSYLIGRGIVIFKNNDRYYGEYNKALNGQGIYYFSAPGFKGDIFVGEFRDGVKSGSGIYFKPDGRIAEIGLYSKDLIEYRHVDPVIFTRIPAGKIPAISSAARAAIESKQAEINKEQAEKQRVAAQARGGVCNRDTYDLRACLTAQAKEAVARDREKQATELAKRNKHDERAAALAKQEPDKKEQGADALDTNRINDPRWGRIAIDQRGARDSLTKKQAFIVDDNFSILYQFGYASAYIVLDPSNGYREAMIELLTTGHLGRFLVDCDRKRYKTKDLLDNKKFESIAWDIGRADDAAARLIMHICRLPSRIQ